MLETALQLGLTEEEYKMILEKLGREPNFNELSMFSVMWSEHCSYKNSILWLKKLPKDGELVLAKAGEENAGLLNIGGGLAVAFKIESHNHPSAIEPYQGAATGIGGIQRDVFSMGARPIATLNSLRFGNISDKKTKHLLKNVVKGIGDYGNAFGVPTVGGEIYFDDCYKQNPLVNAMSVGIVEIGKTGTAVSKGEGNIVLIAGSATGKDGIHGATFASEDISEDSENKLPSVQVGDPFAEKLLLEATLEALATGFVVGLQDMGAAGITCCTTEMSEKGNSGMDIQLDKVPTRQKDMKPFELLLSESQERMLLVVETGKEQEIIDIFHKWDLLCEEIGKVNDKQDVNFYMNDELVASVPAFELVLGGGAPVYEREIAEPKYLKEIAKYNINKIPEPEDHFEVAEFLLSLPNIASKHWVYEQYDSMVGVANTSTNSPTDAAVVKIHNTQKALAITTDCNSRYIFSDPKKGTAMAVAEAARNVVCSGAVPIGITNCLNFGNPYNSEVYWQFSNAILGMKEACEKFNIPVTGGNVSFYNQSEEGPVFPTPVIGMLGLMENAEKDRMSLDFKQDEDLIYVIGKQVENISSSQYLKHFHKVEYSPAPYFNLDEEYKMQEAVLELIDKRLIKSAHDISEGGTLVALMEAAFPNNLGFDILTPAEIREDAFLYGEAGGRVIITVDEDNEDDMLKVLQEKGVEVMLLGLVTNGDLLLDGEDFGEIQDFKEVYENALEEILK